MFLVVLTITMALLSRFSLTSTAEAGLFGSSANSQNIGLAAMPASALGVAAVGGGDITIVGNSALLADAGPLGTVADINDSPTTDQISLYVVRSDDTLSAIAGMYGVSVNTIVWANNLSRGQALKEGDTLVILPVSGVNHTVAKGETLQSIATKYKGDPQEILQFNDLPADAHLTVGDVLIIPDGEEVAPSVPPTKGKAPGGKLRGAGGPSYAGYFSAPLAHYIKTQGLHGFNAVDLAAPSGTPIMAAADGTVIISRAGSWNGGYGNYVVIAHPNGTQTLYAHTSSNAVTVGEKVEQGQVIAKVGSTGHSTGPHVHFEVRGAKNPF